MDPEQMTERMVQQYKLNDTQKGKVLEATKAYTEKMRSMFSGGQPGQFTDAQREEMTKAREAYNTKLKGIFTKDQFAAYTKDQENRGMRRGGQGGQGGPRPPRNMHR
jgi:putative SOS response-associated peptidase YedK